MRKKVLMVFLLVTLLAVVLSGCNENKSDNSKDTIDNIQKFYGTWIGGMYDGDEFDNDESWTFYENGSLYMVTTYDWDEEGEYTNIEWANFEIDTDGELCVSKPEISFLMCYSFKFTDDDSKFSLTLASVEMYQFTKET